MALIRVRGRWGLPKGHMEKGESFKETARREVLEETGLEGQVEEKIGDITYWYTERPKEGKTIRIFKRVYFYLIRCVGGDMRGHDEEVEEAAWFSIEEAMRQLVYPSERRIMRRASAILEGRTGKRTDLDQDA